MVWLKTSLGQELTMLEWRQHCPAACPPGSTFVKPHIRSAAATTVMASVIPPALRKEEQERADGVATQQPAPGDRLLNWLVAEREVLPRRPVRSSNSLCVRAPVVVTVVRVVRQDTLHTCLMQTTKQTARHSAPSDLS